MFKLRQSATYWWPVEFRAPSASRPGEYDRYEIEAQFKRLSIADHTALMDATNAELLLDWQFVARVCTGLRKVVDEHDLELPFSEALLAELLQQPGVATAMAGAYFNSRDGAAEKNSPRSPMPGQLAAS